MKKHRATINTINTFAFCAFSCSEMFNSQSHHGSLSLSLAVRPRPSCAPRRAASSVAGHAPATSKSAMSWLPVWSKPWRWCDHDHTGFSKMRVPANHPSREIILIFKPMSWGSPILRNNHIGIFVPSWPMFQAGAYGPREQQRESLHMGFSLVLFGDLLGRSNRMGVHPWWWLGCSLSALHCTASTQPLSKKMFTSGASRHISVNKTNKWLNSIQHYASCS